jgi:hypothetical protein
VEAGLAVGAPGELAARVTEARDLRNLTRRLALAALAVGLPVAVAVKAAGPSLSANCRPSQDIQCVLYPSRVRVPNGTIFALYRYRKSEVPMFHLAIDPHRQIARLAANGGNDHAFPVCKDSSLCHSVSVRRSPDGSW